MWSEQREKLGDSHGEDRSSSGAWCTDHGSLCHLTRSVALLVASPPCCSAAGLLQNPLVLGRSSGAESPCCSAAGLLQSPPAARPRVWSGVPCCSIAGLVWSPCCSITGLVPTVPLSPCPLVLFSLNLVGDPSATPVRCPPSVLSW